MTETMSNVDNFWLCMDDPTNLMMITGFMEFAEPLDYERLCATLEHRICCFDRFRQRVVKPISGVGAPTWEFDPHFDIRSHVHRIALPAPGDKQALQGLISDYTGMPLDTTKPLWQVHLIENYGDGCVLLVRLHHCIADGIALIFVLLSTTDEDEDAPWPQPREDERRPRNSFLPAPVRTAIKSVHESIVSTQVFSRKIVKGVMDSITNPMHFIEQARNYTGLAADAASVLTKLVLMPPHPHNSFRGELGVRKCVAWTEPIQIGNIKTVGKAMEATLNDVLIATVTGALRRYLTKCEDRVNELDLAVAVPVNIRKPGTEFELGNKFSLVFLSLPVHIEDPVLRLKEVKRRMDELKRSPDAFVGFTLLNTLGMSPAKVARRAAQIFANKTTGVLTNVPGPRQPLYFAGKQIRNIMFWVPRSGRVGLGISIFSYNGTVVVGLASDEKLVPDPEVILDGFEDDFRYMLDLVESGKINEGPLVLHDRYQEARQRKITENHAAEDSRSADNPGNQTNTPKKCKALTKLGKPCKNMALPDSDYCNTHKSKEAVSRVA